MEVFYISKESRETRENYRIWTALLARGKRIWAIAGGDGHACCSDAALTTIYAAEKSSAAILDQLRRGDFTCGPVGIRMCVGDTRMGGTGSFAGARLILGIGDFHRSVLHPQHEYRADLLSDEGIEWSRPITATEPAFFAMDVQNRKFYRAEIWDVTRDLRIAIGNPIWNAAFYG